MRLLLIVAFLVGVLAAPAAAQVEPLPAGTWLVPRDGESWRASSWPAATPFEMVDFTIYAHDYDEPPDRFAVAVATSPATGPDGLLAAENAIDSYSAEPRPAQAGIYSARTRLDARWLGTPGTYYWQASYEEDDEDELYASPVRALTIVPRPPPDPPAPVPARPAPYVAPPLPAPAPRPPAASTARIVVRRAIVAATHMSPRGLVYRCAIAPGAADCRPSWRDVRARYRGTLRVTFGLGGITAAFTGSRSLRSCTHRCVRAVTWTTTLG